MAPTGMSQSGTEPLPFAEGQTFATLDGYLAHLERLGGYDTPWWKLVGPDRYELITRRAPGQKAQTATRAQLLERYGFDR